MHEVVGFDECFATSTLLQLININTTVTVPATSSENKSIKSLLLLQNVVGPLSLLPMGDLAGNFIPTFTI